MRAALLLCLAAVAAGARLSPSDSIRKPHAPSLPVVIWHGMGDSCCAAGGLGQVKRMLETELGVFVHSIATGKPGEFRDVWSSFYGNVNAQVDQVCDELEVMEELKGGFNMLGFSQGGQFLRAVVQRCAHRLPGPVHTLVTLGAQHQGVMNTPGCRADISGAAAKACGVMQALLGRGAYAPWVRENVVQAQYFKDPHELPSYLANNIFLPDINNERAGDRDPRYADNLASLQRLVLFRFDDDTTVVPRDSAWFYFHNGSAVVPLEEQPIYQQDWIGLRRLDEAGGLIFERAPGEHMQFTLAWFRDAVLDQYLRSGDGPAPDASDIYGL